MRHYETIYILNPNLPEEEYREAINKFNSLIDKQKGVIIKTKEWGKQRLAYDIKKFNYGSYVLIDFCAEPGLTAGHERDLKLDDRVLKYQTVKLEDKADPQELILKEKETEKKAAAEEDQGLEKEPETPDQKTVTDSEVKNGVSATEQQT
ncbi:MAG: 30S ribosomal protein S6 [Deltaproteobacteria bacterium]|nr:30S ribosomal protein S6 [Deltaproteobacteria bacterium]